MRRSSGIRLVAFLIALGLATSAAQARGFVAFAPHPAVFRPTTPVAPVRRAAGPRLLDPRNPGLTIGQTLVTRGRRPGRRFYGGGLGYDGYDDYDGLGYGTPQPAATATGADPPPPYAIPGPPAPCLPPQIIKIDGGLAHPPRTRVVYGTPACGGP